MRLVVAALAALCVYTAVVPPGARAQSGRTHALIVVGSGGTAEFRESFHAEASQIYTALTTTHGLAKEDVLNTLPVDAFLRALPPRSRAVRSR